MFYVQSEINISNYIIKQKINKIYIVLTCIILSPCFLLLCGGIQKLEVPIFWFTNNIKFLSNFRFNDTIVLSSLFSII